ARRMRSTLIAEGLVPSNIDPFAGFYNRSWSTTDKEQNVRQKRAIIQTIKQHIESLDDVTNAHVEIVIPEDTLFRSDQNPVTASIILRKTPTSDLFQNRRRILGIQTLVQNAVEGLRSENITISDEDGNILNDLEGMQDFDRLSLVAKQQREIQKLETFYEAKILKSLQATYTEDRVRELDVKIDMDMSKKTSSSTEYTPFVLRPDNPNTPWDDSELKETITISHQTVTREWQGTGFNPEGPSGTEGQTPPVYSDMSNVIGHSTETGVTENRVANTTQSEEEKSPNIDRVTVSVNIDGNWVKHYDPKTHALLIDEETGGIKRNYIPIPKEQLEETSRLVRDAIGYNQAKNYSVTVTNIPFDRTAEHEAENEAYWKSVRTRQIILISLGTIILVLILFIIIRLIMRERERRRRKREEEMLRRQQAAREQALWDAKEDGMGVTMSVEESRRAELLENAIAMAKEHPEDVAMLIRTWLMEE
ncbi:MAG: flagellar M-ring protein FliF, partial [Treponema sp.]|nr:flagellar M-ring protein FliF [Treponema sp.]